VNGFSCGAAGAASPPPFPPLKCDPPSGMLEGKPEWSPGGKAGNRIV
jgi:hypothetical protein